MTWDVRIADRPDADAARRLTAFVTASSSGHLYQLPLLDRIEDGPSVRPIWAWSERGGAIGASAVARLRRVRGLGPWVARIDRGPVVADLDAVGPLLASLCDRLRRAGATAVRVNPMRRRDDDGGLAEALARSEFAPVPDDDYDVTLEVDIAKDPETLLAAFAKGTRYAIRQALKAGVRCERAVGLDEIRALESLYADMVERKGATPRPPRLFERLFEYLQADPARGFVLVSRFAGAIVGAIVVTRCGERALYTYGASRDADDGIPKTHLLQYEAMVASRSLGCTVYDLGGFSAGVGAEGSRTAAQSINFFKSRFTKNEVAFLPCHERVLRPILHGAVEAARRLRAGSGRPA